ncbi:MAG: TerB family tellurite resistance protein [bacterium]
MKRAIRLEGAQLAALCDLLMAAAHADGEFDGLEAGEIADVLDEVVQGTLPAEISIRLSRYNTSSFDLHAAAAPLQSLSVDDKEAILSLVTRVIEADDLHDLAEADFIRAVAGELGCDTTQVEAATFEVEILSPPPLPKG